MHLAFFLTSMLLVGVMAEENSCTLAFCNSCINKAVECTECPSDKTLSEDHKSCLDCPTDCKTCVNDGKDGTKCEKCDAEYFVNSDDECTKCIDDCIECSDDTTCDVCVTGLSFNEDTKACEGCKVETYKDASGTCNSCPSNAESCSDDGTDKPKVTTCKATYVANVDEETPANSKTKCLKCDSTCTECDGKAESSTKSKCTKCLASLYLQEGKCVKCETDTDESKPKCTECDDEGKCSTCVDRYIAEDGSCTSCKANCLKCKIGDDGTECETCDTKFGLNKGDTCESCPSNCAVCAIVNGVKTCSSCKEGFGLQSGACTACPSNCNKCTYDSTNSGHDCTECKGRYVVNSDDDLDVCADCLDNCATCAAEDTCATCDNGYKLQLNAAGTAKTVCMELPAECTALDLDAGDDDPVCETCNDGFVVKDKTCSKCTAANCKTCANDALDKCTTCYDGYKDDSAAGKLCHSCIATSIGAVANCKTCTIVIAADGVTTATCTACMAGYVENADPITECKKCSSHCKTCTYVADATPICTDCDAEYAVQTGKCVKCPGKCTKCTATDDSVTCADDGCPAAGTAKDSEGTCTDCSEHCTTCALDDSEVKCTDCDTKFGLSDEKTCIECPANCAECELGEESGVMECTTCDSTYDLTDDQCSACPANCMDCKYVAGSMECEKCAATYVLKDKVCQKCPGNCKECGSPVKCNKGKCESGYGLNTDSACVLCSILTFENCKMCSDHPGGNDTADCFTCQPNYVLKDELTKGDDAACIATTVDCAGKAIRDPAPECAADGCTDDTEINSDKLCSRQCFQCGVPNEKLFINPSACKSDNASAESIVVDCLVGICFAVHEKKDGVVTGVYGGCMTDEQSKECDDKMIDGVCRDIGELEECKRCCKSGQKCNHFMDDLNLKATAAKHIVSSLMFVMLIAFVHFF